jgi:glycosyltransferase involved in cell wall biosynthesis
VTAPVDPAGDAAFPRVLFVTPAAFNHLTGGGITFTNLFAGWPKDRLATVHNDEVATTNDVCERYFRLGRTEIDVIAPLRIARLFRDPAATAAPAHAPGGVTGAPGLLARLQGDSAPQRARLTAELERFIAAFDPQLLYTILGGNAVMSLVAAIRRRFALPLVVHLMDDFPSILYRRGVFAAVERARMRALVAKHVGSAATCMGIAPPMCAAFEKRYGRPFLAFQNCVDVERWRAVVRKNAIAAGRDFRVLYFGSVFANVQLASLIELCRSVARLRDAGMPIFFDIASPAGHVAPHRKALVIDPAIRLVEPTQDDGAFYAALAAADALVLPINFDAGTVEFIRYSMPTKVPAYMASGTPILVYGPAGVAQVDYAAGEGWGLVVDKRNPDALDEALRRVLTDAGLREGLHRRAQALAAEHHDAARVRTRFQDALTSAARGSHAALA